MYLLEFLCKLLKLLPSIILRRECFLDFDITCSSCTKEAGPAFSDDIVFNRFVPQHNIIHVIQIHEDIAHTTKHYAFILISRVLGLRFKFRILHNKKLSLFICECVYF